MAEKDLIRHGHAIRGSISPTYRSWVSMKTRCLREDNIEWENYGARGISICQRWIDSFSEFLKDLGPRPLGMTLDRIDPNGDYEPGNVQWADASTQARNTRRTKYVSICGERLSVIAACERFGVNYTSVKCRAWLTREHMVEAFFHVFSRKFPELGPFRGGPRRAISAR